MTLKDLEKIMTDSEMRCLVDSSSPIVYVQFKIAWAAMQDGNIELAKECVRSITDHLEAEERLDKLLFTLTVITCIGAAAFAILGIAMGW